MSNILKYKFYNYTIKFQNYIKTGIIYDKHAETHVKDHYYARL